MTNRTCEICGSTANVVAVMAWVGGRGHVERHRCLELLACWRRADARANEEAAAASERLDATA